MKPESTLRREFVSVPEQFPNSSPSLHQPVDRESNQQAIESCCSPWPKTTGMHDDEGDVAANTYAQPKKDLDASMVNFGLTCYDFNLAKATSPDSEYKAQAVANIGFGDGQKNV
jgi:hypothetical protein